MTKITVLITDDHGLFRNGLQGALCLNKDIGDIYQASNSEEALEVIRTKNIDLVFMDISMKGTDGIVTTKMALKIKPDLKVIALSQFDDEENVNRMILSGAKGYLVKTSEVSIIFEAIESVMNDKPYFSQEVMEAVFMHHLNERKNLPSTFTDMQDRILKLICKGQQDKEIGKVLGISHRTVQYHKTRMMQISKTKTTNELVAYAIKTGKFVA